MDTAHVYHMPSKLTHALKKTQWMIILMKWTECFLSTIGFKMEVKDITLTTKVSFTTSISRGSFLVPNVKGSNLSLYAGSN